MMRGHGEGDVNGKACIRAVAARGRWSMRERRR